MKFVIIEYLEVIEIIDKDITKEDFDMMDIEDQFELFDKDYYSDNVCNEMMILTYDDYLEIHNKNIKFIEGDNNGCV